MLIWSQKDLSYALEMLLKKALLHICEARKMFNIVNVCKKFKDFCVKQAIKSLASTVP